MLWQAIAADAYRSTAGLSCILMMITQEQDLQSPFVRVGEVLPEVLKQIISRFELRQRLEGERGSISDEEFLEIAERSGGVEL